MSPILRFLIDVGAFEEACALLADPDGPITRDELALKFHDLVEEEVEGADAAAAPAGLAEAKAWVESARDADCVALAEEVRGCGGWVPCSLCGRAVPARTAHIHNRRHIGDECCWDERLRASE